MKLKIKLTFYLVSLFLLQNIAFSNELDNRAADDMDFLIEASKKVTVDLLDLEDNENRKKKSISKKDVFFTDEISTGLAAPLRKKNIQLNRSLNIQDRPVTSVKNLMKRGR